MEDVDHSYAAVENQEDVDTDESLATENQEAEEAVATDSSDDDFSDHEHLLDIGVLLARRNRIRNAHIIIMQRAAGLIEDSSSESSSDDEYWELLQFNPETSSEANDASEANEPNEANRSEPNETTNTEAISEAKLPYNLYSTVLQYPAGSFIVNQDLDRDVALADLEWTNNKQYLECSECQYLTTPHSFLRTMHLLHGGFICPKVAAWDMEKELRRMLVAFAQSVYSRYFTRNGRKTTFYGFAEQPDLWARDGWFLCDGKAKCFGCGMKCDLDKLDNDRHLHSNCVFVKISRACYRLGLERVLDDYEYYCELRRLWDLTSMVNNYGMVSYDADETPVLPLNKDPVDDFKLLIADWRNAANAFLQYSRAFLGYDANIKVEAATNEENKCPVCWINKKNMAFACGHIVCSECLKQIKHNCPICKQPSNISLRVFI